MVDFQGEGGRGVEAGCAAGSPASGMAALASAGFPVDPFGGSVVCRIDSLPSSGSCNMMPPARAFWSYWTATDGTNWSFSNEGAARRPKPGTTEGWSFARTKPGEPTRQAPPPRPPSVQAPTTTPPTTPPPTSPPATASPGSGGAGTGTGKGPGTGTGSGSQEGGSPGSGAAPTNPGSAASPGRSDEQGGSSTKSGDEAASEKNGPGGPNDPATGDDTPPESGTTTPATNSEVPDGSATAGSSLPGFEGGTGGDEVAGGKAADGKVQNSARARQANDDQDRGSPVPAIFAVVAVITLLGIGVRASRRNRAAS